MIFPVVYGTATAVLVVFELTAVLARKAKGDTITEITKASLIRHMGMVALLVWGVHHFVLSDWVAHPLLDFGAVVVGLFLGALANRRHHAGA